MTKEEFIEFIKELGFVNTWQSIDDKYHMETNIVGLPRSNCMSLTAFVDQLKIIIVDDIFQLSLSQISSHIMTSKNFGIFHLATFGDDEDFQLEIFLSFIKGSFNNPPKNIIQYMRDKKISDILK
jgi:hypothetical protein